MNSKIVMKFGGTSLGSIARIEQVASRIKKNIDENKKLIVVVSAMSGETNNLIRKTEYFSNCKFNSEYDSILASGEQISAGLLTLCLIKKKVSVRSLMGWQIPILTDQNAGNAKILSIDNTQIISLLNNYNMLVVCGFQGVDENNRITTLGRGGSDTSAVAIAASIKADICEIYTDVDGIFTADPRDVRSAQKISKISYEETLEMASLGSKVLHPRSVELAMKYDIKLHVRNSFNNSNGTLLVKEDEEMEKEIVSGISSTETESKITLLGIPDTPGVASRIFSPLTESNINVDMIVQNITEDGKFTNLTFTVNNNETLRAVSALKKSKLRFKDIHVDKNICKLSIIGVGMKSNVGVAQKMFETLAKNKINIKVISTSEIKISVLISLKKKKIALNALHKAYNLGKNR